MTHNMYYRDNKHNQKLWHKNTDLVISNPDLYEGLMSAYTVIEGKKYQELGFLRVDYINHPAVPKEKLLADLSRTRDDQAQIGIHMPTSRYEPEGPLAMEKIKQGNYFAFQDFDLYKLNDALKVKHRYLIVELYSYEMQMFEDFNSQFSNIAFLNSDYLFRDDFDLYELFGDADFLITDFSSIHLDYSYLDKPIISITNYLGRYERVHGLSLSPYGDVAPGSRVSSQEEFLQVLRHPDDHQYKDQRFYWRELIDEVDNSDSCEFIFNYMTRKF